MNIDQNAPPPPYYMQQSSPSAPMPPPTNGNGYGNIYPQHQFQQPQQTNTNNYMPTLSREERFRQIISKHEISQEFSKKLQLLQGFKIVFLFDDSGSMNTSLKDSPLNTGNLLNATRWEELKYFAEISIEIASLFDQNGTDIHFLNRPPLRNIMNAQQLVAYFNNKPNGYTPLTRTLSDILSECAPVIAERKLLIVIVTDGEPTDELGRVDIKGFKRSLLSRNPINRIFTTIVACTDDDSSIDYLNKWDRQIKHLDVVDDYRNERNEVRKHSGKSMHFSYGDYVVKSLVGSIDPALDRADEQSRCTLL